MLNVLLADDEPSIRLPVGEELRESGFEVVVAADGQEALDQLQKRSFDVVISDVRMPRVDGMKVFRHVRSESPQTAFILITAHGDIHDAVSALREGAHDYLIKPFDTAELVIRLQRIEERLRLSQELREARSALHDHGVRARLIGQSQPMVALLKRLETIAPTDASVVIQGESGTGKEVVARSLHEASPRRDKPFVAVNCAAFPETLIEAELFGHERGAFTGAANKRDGRFKAAHGGTILLDEVGEIPLMVQAKLLRVLQEGEVEPLGSNTPIKVDVRVLCATHRNLKQLIDQGKFREDLYYRLNVLEIRVPALRERRADLPLLVAHFWKRHTGSDDEPQITPRAWAAISNYHFPGNVRELEHAIHHAVVLSRGAEVDVQHLPPDVVGFEVDDMETPQQRVRPLAESLREYERQCLLHALNVTEGKKGEAAKLLGISRKNLWEKLKSHDITLSELDEITHADIE